MYFIYQLYFENFPDFCYIGMTKNMKTRLRLHKSACNNKYKKQIKLYDFMIQNNLQDKINYLILEELETNEKDEAKKIERFYIETIQPNLNVSIPLRTSKEYFIENKKDIYYRRNIKNIQKREINRQKSIEYYYKNKKERLKKHKLYLLTPKGIQAREKQKRRIICRCGKEISFRSLRYHIKCVEHKKFLCDIITSKNKLIYSNKNINTNI
tara:strand:- start:590 stop:1222 length:633 start_codon:yes stop_codon:yes gene_type:complete